MELNIKCLNDFKLHALGAFPEEACGLVVDGAYKPCKNIAVNPTQDFVISPLDYLNARSTGTLQAVLHSHPITNKAAQNQNWPSGNDMTGWIQTKLPWGIIATDGIGTTSMTWLDDNVIPPLLGRYFVHGVTDCYSLIRDYYRTEKKIEIKNYARDMGWWEQGKDLYSENFNDAGFENVPFKELQIGDALLMKIKSPVVNHAAIVTGSNEIMHHLYHRQSCTDSLDKWRKFITNYLHYVRS